jgi:hypothetical protein
LAANRYSTLGGISLSHDKVWTTFFYPLLPADPVKDQEIKR